MSLDIKVPPVGESISEVTLSRWIKQDGDQVEMDEVIAELESDKATFELTAEKAGTLKTIAREGDTLAIGQTVCTIEEGPASADAPASTDAPAAPVSGSTDSNVSVDIKVPPVGESITEVVLSRWMKKDGDRVEMDEAIAELESDKATFELTAEQPGILKIHAREGDTLAIGAVVCSIQGGPAPAAAPAKEEKAAPVSSEKDVTYAAGTPSPSAAKILSEKGIEPSAVSGTGVGGRITKEDAMKAQAGQKAAPAKAGSAAPAAPAAAQGARSERREKMSALRKTVARRLVTVKNETAMLTTFNEVDMQPIMDLRAKYKDKFKEKHGVGLGFMSFFTKAVCEALKEFPAVNARIEGEEIVYSDFADISIAVSAPKGLVVPVIRNADAMSLAEIEKAVL
ncbi:MAG TPA: 2-oxo acid dehydrogenase subunit E2, partial [Sphingobacteriaceae bacterium]